MIFFANKRNGKFEWEAPIKYSEFIDHLPDCRISVDIKRYRKPRTLNQNAYYWKCLEIAGESLGYNREELHDSFRAMFLTDRSKEIPLIRSSRLLTTSEFTIYLDKVLRKLAELSIVVMTPEEFYATQ